MSITNGRVFGGGGGGGDPEHFDIKLWLFIDNLTISEQTIDRALTIHTELHNYESMKKNYFI